MVPEVDDHKKLAQEVRASLQLLKRVGEQCLVENDHQAPPAVPCLCQKNFLLPPESIFACRDIQEIQCEKMVAYTWALAMEATMDATLELTEEKRPPNKFSGWKKVLHPSRPVVVARQILLLLRSPRQRPHSQRLGEGLVQIPQPKEPRVLTAWLEPLSPTKELEVAQ